jgi:hypothetical protein
MQWCHSFSFLIWFVLSWKLGSFLIVSIFIKKWRCWSFNTNNQNRAEETNSYESEKNIIILVKCYARVFGYK